MPAAVEAEARKLIASGLDRLTTPAFDADMHFVDPSDPVLTVQYLLVVDALNFCFWPDGALAPHSYAAQLAV